MSKFGFLSSPRERERELPRRLRAIHCDCSRNPLRLRYFLLPFLLVASCLTSALAQNVSIGTAAANNSALLHLESTNKGLLIPRLTNTQMLAVASPATGD